MKISKSFCFIVLTFFASVSLAQQSNLTVSGVIKDASTTLPGATVVLLNAKDSTLESFNASDAEGKFQLKKVRTGKYILQISSMGYQSYTHDFELKSGDTDLVLPDVILKPKNTQLKEVDVTADHIPIKINGDTIEYNAKAFKTQPNAVVEDLLKKLPGVDVDKDGNVSAKGKKVSKVLVDGKEFFGDDPKMATKNLPADAVSQVQVFDKKSDMADFMGIDDGERETTINLKLKDDKKQGLFGKVSGGYGTKDRYEARTNINRFGKNLQLSAIGMANNTNQQGFSVMDYINFMGGIKGMMSGAGGGGRMTMNAADAGIPVNLNNSDGFTSTAAGGVNLNYDFSAKTEFRSSYFYNNINKTIDKELFRQNFQGENTFNTNENSSSNTENTSHRINLILRQKIDSTQRINWKNNISFTGENGNSDVNNFSSSSDQSRQTQNFRTNRSDNSGYKGTSSLNYLKRLKKKGRNFGIEGSFSFKKGLTNSGINSLNYLMPGSAFQRIDTVEQLQRNDQDQIGYGSKVTYTEPIGKWKYLELSYSYQRNQNDQQKNFTDIVYAPQRQEIPNDVLSNIFFNRYEYHKFGTNFRYNRKKHNISPGIYFQQSYLNGGTGKDSLVKRSFPVILPKLTWNFSISQSQRLDVVYQTNQNEPSVDQLQPVVNNTDPFNLTFGNPDLAPEYSHNLSLNFSSFDQFSFMGVFGNLSGTYTKNKITYERTITKELVQSSRPINVDKDIVVNSYGGFSTPIRLLGIKINTSINSIYNRGIVFVDSIRNNTDRWINTYNISVENRKKDFIDAMVGFRLTQNLLVYSSNTRQNERFNNYTSYVDITTYFKKNWSLNSTFDYSIYRGNELQERQVIPIWKAYISKQFLKNNRAELKLSAIDILDKNVGIQRNNNYNYVQDERIQSLGRYFLLTFTYSLSKFPDPMSNNKAFKFKGF